MPVVQYMYLLQEQPPIFIQASNTSLTAASDTMCQLANSALLPEAKNVVSTRFYFSAALKPPRSDKAV